MTNTISLNEKYSKIVPTSTFEKKNLTYDFMIPNPNWQHSDETNRANVEKLFEVRSIA